MNLAKLPELPLEERIAAEAHIARLVENFKATRWARPGELPALSVQVNESLAALELLTGPAPVEEQANNFDVFDPRGGRA
jgi:hypothetical protein